MQSGVGFERRVEGEASRAGDAGTSAKDRNDSRPADEGGVEGTGETECLETLGEMRQVAQAHEALEFAVAIRFF
jgi:hypothetical protein